jgi:autophagy-related protein 11
MLEVEDWTQSSQHSKRRSAAKRITPDKDSTPSVLNLHPGPPQAEVEESFPTAPLPASHLAEESFRTTRPPTSHLFPARSRSNSSPNAGPSSLSRLLAQAPAETSLEMSPPSRSASPLLNTSPPPPPSPTRTSSATHGYYAPSIPSPLRPGSRASRQSSSSRFSVGRIPPLGSTSSVSSGVTKTAPTTALSDHLLFTAPSSLEGDSPNSPSPTSSATDVKSSISLHRRRTTSYHIPRTSPLVTTSETINTSPINAGVGSAASSTLASLANSWGVSFGRKKKAEIEHLASAESSPDASGSGPSKTEPSASELLKRF